MTLHRDDPLLNPDEEPALLSRRGLLRRTVYGITGIGLASLLAACGGDDEGEDEAEDDETENPSGVEDIDEQPADEDPAGGAGLDGEEGEGGEGN